ncbi:MAG TPA: DUF362 domain-containing protein [Bacteroidales bacterium]|nr:DUF362 domain-containing protein [Bacteroidales bacterium]HRT89906.1 DUF362 domain-containing protein [Bacteroidales bacterium]
MKNKNIKRRRFFALLGAGSLSALLRPLSGRSPEPSAGSGFVGKLPQQTAKKPSTNIADAAKVPRNASSMPGKFPGKVVHLKNQKAVAGNVIIDKEANLMIEKGMLELTGQKNIKSAWRMFVSPGEKIGLKVNPVAGKDLATSHAVVKSVIKQLTAAGIKKEDIIIWDRREMQLHECGFDEKNYPGIKIMGTEQQDKNGSYYDSEGKLYGERNIDKEWYYYADVEQEYDAETIPFMVNGGKYSYFSRIVTSELDKIINIPILKNAGGSITNAMKNLAFGSITNTGRLHASLWNDTCAEVCAFAPLRDKVVLTVCDALKGCFNGGPGANPQFFCNYNSILIATDPVALDRIAYDIVAEKRIAEGLQKAPAPQVLTFLTMAEKLQLGTAGKEKINVSVIDLG